MFPCCLHTVPPETSRLPRKSGRGWLPGLRTQLLGHAGKRSSRKFCRPSSLVRRGLKWHRTQLLHAELISQIKHCPGSVVDAIGDPITVTCTRIGCSLSVNIIYIETNEHMPSIAETQLNYVKWVIRLAYGGRGGGS